ncbi:serine/threonine-protein kinase 11-interacting protein [Euwallacea similis]|uniref:serine/threonine-protein kinase 11-interacting protein n=1 Tax=Euwallacea similis TaxID=1736056 RepID=UPI00344FDDCF
MTESTILSTVANLLRPVSKDVSRGKGKLCLSTVYLSKLNKAFDENAPENLTSSFHLTEAKASLQVDLQFLLDLVKSTIALKVIPDLVEDEESSTVNISRFKNIKTLEIHKIDVKRFRGIQKLRSQIEQLSCLYNLDNLSDILDKCGGDLSHSFNWGELKRGNFSHNQIQEIDTVFEVTPWLQTLDLSHNHIKCLNIIDNLPNLKELNLSYNKLESVPKFKGAICKRLHILLLNNNFIEDITSLSTLADLHQLDLTQNCLLDHKSLLSISQMPSLYSLDLRGNPISFHSIHRTLTCNYFNKNTATLNVVLDNIPLTKIEKSMAGSHSPISQSSLGSSGSFPLQNSLDNSLPKRQRKVVRTVTIQDSHDIQRLPNKVEPVIPSPRNTDKSHLDIKKKIEQGLQEGTQPSSVIFENILNYPKNVNSLESTSNQVSSPNNPESDKVSAEINEFVEETTRDDKLSPAIEFNTNLEDSESLSDDDDDDDDDDDILEGQTFVAGTRAEADDLCIAITKSHLSEKDIVTMTERERWSLDVLKSFKQGEDSREVKIEFDIMRRDKMFRVYYLEEAEKFIKELYEGMLRNKIPEDRIQYQCMKCNGLFSRSKKGSSVLLEEKVTCPKCGSNHVIESK